MVEKKLERKLKNAVRKKSGVCLKFSCPGTRGAPDRIVIMPGKIYFVELKIRPGVKPSPIQKVFHAGLLSYGFPVWIINDDQSLNSFINGI